MTSTAARDGTRDPLDAFIDAACVPLDHHASGTLDRANAILAAHPDVATRDIHAAAILGDDETVRRILERDPALATAKGGPRGWDALTHLCFSRYLRLDAARSDAFVRAARALLDAGADANTGWFERDHLPQPTWESAIYGAAGFAHHAELTRLLLERGADPNDEETPNHAAETYDNAALRVLVESGELSDDNLATILLRKTDWHDVEGIRWLLAHGVAPDRMTRWGKTALHNALLSDNSLAIVELLLDHGADPTLIATRPDRSASNTTPRSAIAIAARRGRGDVLELLARRGVPIALDGVDALIAACARADAAGIREIVARDPSLVPELVSEGGARLATFAGNGNVDGVRALLDLGVDVDARFAHGDGYFGIAPASTALHVAAWRAAHATVALLIERGANVAARDGAGRTPLALAVRACVDSYWMSRRAPASIEALLRAGASPAEVAYPTGYAEADALLARYARG